MDFPTLSPHDTKRLRLCRICRRKDSPQKEGFGGSFLYNFGKEYAHEECIERVKAMGYTLPKYKAVKEIT